MYVVPLECASCSIMLKDTVKLCSNPKCGKDFCKACVFRCEKCKLVLCGSIGCMNIIECCSGHKKHRLSLM